MTAPATNFSGEDVRLAAKRLIYRRDITRFFREQLRIRTKEIGFAPLVPRAPQASILRGIQEQLQTQGKVRQLWFKGRQVGGSTLAAGIIWHKTALLSGVNSFVVAQDRTTASKLFNMYDLFHKSMDADIRPPRRYFTKGLQISLGDDPDDPNSRGMTSDLLTAEAKNINLGVGNTVHCLHLSEICRYPQVEPLTESLFPACSDAPGTIRIIESTAHFAAGADYFKDQCLRAMKGKGEWQFHFVPWWLQPEYATPLLKGERIRLGSKGDYPDERRLVNKVGLTHENIKWRRAKIDEFKGDVTLFYLSYPTDFEEGWITRESSAFPYERMMDMHKDLRPPVKRFTIAEGRLFEDPEGLLYVWRMPEPNTLYDIGGDIAGGDGATDGMENARAGDWSVAEVIQRGTNEQCAEWRGHILPREFGDVLAAIGRMYNTAQVGPEVNSFGMSTLERLKDTYPNIYLWRKRDGIGIKFTGKLGWVTTYESKNLCVNMMREKIYYRQVIIHSDTLWDEMKNFVREFTPTGMVTYAGANGRFDDCVMAFMIAIIISDDENFDKYNTLSVREEKPKEKEPMDPAYYDAVGLHPVQEDSLQVDIGGWK